MVGLSRLVFSCEFLKPKDIIEQNAVELLAETNAHLALKQSFEELQDDAFKLMLSKFKDLGISKNFIPWPMLPVEDGYYANEISVDKFSSLVKKTLDWYCDNNFEIPDGILVDLEPPTDPEAVKKAEQVRLEGKKEEKKSGGLDVMAFVGKIIDNIDENMNEKRFNEAAHKFSEMQDMVHEYGTQCIAVALPLAYEDIFDGKLLLQDFMTVPITHDECMWDHINWMIFNTDYVAATKGIITNEDYRHLLYVYAKEFINRLGKERSSITLGITHIGIQDTRAIQTDPELYRLEASALLSAGMDSIGIYALDGVLKQKNPKAWIETVLRADPKDFKLDEERLELCQNVRRIFQALDFIMPVAKYLVDSGKIMDIIQKVASGGLF
ncbi:MAG: hypothetical protein ACTSWN_12535 [Promethearchaeota archaeon]